MKRSISPAKLKQFVLLFVISITFSLGCKKKEFTEPELPAATMEGKNTFGCKFGMQTWVPGNVSKKLNVSYNTSKRLSILCYRRNRLDPRSVDNILITVYDVAGVGQYIITPQNSEIEINTLDKLFFLQDTGMLKITLADTDRRIVSGEFSFTVKEKTTGEIVDVSQGRFDAKYF